MDGGGVIVSPPLFTHKLTRCNDVSSTDERGEMQLDVETQASAGIDTLIERRAQERSKADAEANLWRISECKHFEKKREANRLAWLDYHEGQAVRLRHTLEALVSKHEQAAERLIETLQRGD